MGFLNWIVGILAICTPTLVAKEEATELSIAVLVVLVGLSIFHRRNALRGWNPGSLGESSNSRKIPSSNSRKIPSSRFELDAHQVNDSLYELYKPDGVPTMQVLFFHGLPFGECSDVHLSTWISGDGLCIWPKVWLAKKFPNAHILVVSYIECLKNGSAETFDMRIICENLTSDLIQANIGQMANCPVVLVGHSFGGLVIKSLCLEAHNSLISPTNNAKVREFLNNLRGVFYYSTPHHGSAKIERARSVLSRPLFEYFTVLSTKAARLNYYFNHLRNSYPKWQIGGLGEQLPVERGLFQGIVIVPEASARDGETFNVDNADHFSICRPDNTISRRFHVLTTLLDNICDNLKDEKAMAQKQAVRQNLQHLPNQMINVDGLLEDVKNQLQKYKTLGFVGMGGLGKTTLVKAVFNELSPKFEYSCFVPDVKLIEGTVEEAKQAVWKHMHRFGRKVGDKDDFSDLTGKGLLVVLDDVSDDCHITLLTHLAQSSSPQSHFIATSRNRLPLNSLNGIYEVPFLDKQNAQKLFLSHAFPKQAIVPPGVEPYMLSVVEKCGGLPLTLEVIGKYLKLKKDGKFWEQTLQALEKAEAVQDLDTRLWAKLRVSYDGLGEIEKQMFLDATTFFGKHLCNQNPFSLREVKAAWRAAYSTEYESLLWQTLVDRSLVYHVEENERIRVHDQLLSLAQKIASESARNGQCRIWEETTASKQLKDISEENQDIHSLRLFHGWHDRSYHVHPHHISGLTLRKLKKLRYLEVDGPLIIDGVEEGTSFPRNLVLLKCVGDPHTFDLPLQNHLVVLHLSYVEVLPNSIGQLSALRFFIGEGIESVPDEFGNLSRLERLEISYCFELQGLPDSFGNLSALKHLEIRECDELQGLPDSFGNLSALNYLEINCCLKLQGLPDSFGNLSALNHLEISECHELQGLPESFGNLSALKHLEISESHKLQGLPDSFGNLSALNHLEISDCRDLHAFPNAIGNLLALEELKLTGCCFEALPNSFEKLSTLRHLELEDCENFFSLIPFSKLTQLQYLEVHGRDRLIQMEKLPESLAELTALSHVILDCVSIRRIPDFLKSMQSLHILELKTLPYIKELPPWLGETGAAPLARSRKMFVVQDGCFRLTSEEPEITSSEWLIEKLHDIAMEKVEESDYEGALANLCPVNLGVLGPKLESFLLRERGIARRFIGDLKGALADLTAAMKVLSDADDGLLRHDSYELSKHRGYIKYLLGDEAGARRDAERCMAMMPEVDGRECLGGLPVAFLEFRLKGRVVNELKLNISSRKAVMGKVKGKDFLGALAIWDEFDARGPGFDDRFFFLQERGVLKRMGGDLPGALEDLTAALKIEEDYDCFKHRGYVKYLMGDQDGAQTDVNQCIVMGLKESSYNYLGGFPVTFLGFDL